MFHNISRLKIACLLRAAVFSLASLLSVSLRAQTGPTGHTPPPEEVTLVGRVLAAIDTVMRSSDLNCRYESFIFGAESSGERGKKIIVPVKISHAYYADEEPFPGSFYDHSKLYEFRVRRDHWGDETVNDLAYD